MLCKVYQVYRSIGKEDKRLREEKKCKTDRDINVYVDKMSRKYGQKCWYVMIDVENENGVVVCQHIV